MLAAVLLQSYSELVQKLLLCFMPPPLLLLTSLASAHLYIGISIHFWSRSRYETEDSAAPDRDFLVIIWTDISHIPRNKGRERSVGKTSSRSET
jgi:hypothetical protein